MTNGAQSKSVSSHDKLKAE